MGESSVWALVIAVLAWALSAGGILAYVTRKFTIVELGQLENRRQIRALYKHLFKNSEIAAVAAGVLAKNSPVQMKPETAEKFRGIWNDLKEFYDSIGQPVPEDELFRQLLNNDRLTDRLFGEISLPSGWTQDATVRAAVRLLKESEGQS